MPKLTAVLFFLTILGYGQQLRFRGEIVKDIVIGSSIGFYDFKNQTNVGTEDHLKIEYNTNLQKYFVVDYFNTSFKKSSNDSLKDEKKEKHIATNQLNNFEIDTLLGALNKYITPLNFSSLKLNNAAFLSLTNKKSIRKEIKRNKKYYPLNRRIFATLEWWFVSKEEKRNLILACQNTDTLNFYLKSQFDSTLFDITTDQWCTFSIKIITTKEFLFTASPQHHFVQPWHDMSLDFFNAGMLNPNINRQLVKILPKDFLIKKTLGNSNLISEYLNWYLKRQYIIFD